MINTRIGYGYDMHQLQKGTQIILGGIQIDSNYSVVALSLIHI